jgi:hypothetical protein
METSNAYWAGFFDGEGCINPEKYVSKEYNEKFIIGVKVCVTQKEPLVAALMQQRFGGHVRTHSITTVSGKKSSITRWELNKAEEVMKFLEAMRPYLIIKGIEADIALELLSRVIKPRETQFRKDSKGRKFMKRKAPLDLQEIKARQLLEMAFYKERSSHGATVIQN